MSILTAQVIKLTDEEYKLIRDMVYEYCGIYFQEHKKYIIENRLSRRLKQLNFTSFKDYYYFLKYDRKKDEELVEIMNLLTINETYFFRELGQLKHMISVAIPELVKSKSDRVLRIWSAACSTGEEPYSISILLKDSGVLPAGYRVEIYGTDLSQDAVAKAKAAKYRKISFRSTEPQYMKYFREQDAEFTVNADVRLPVKIDRGNLLLPADTGRYRNMDIVFCRNVLIYFDKESKRKVIENLANALQPQGYLYIGHSETLFGISDAFRMNNFGEGIVYMKK
ncbi:Protein-glutamate O-methyltransferase [Desulfurispirillum indicum S5]|uniref:protein-glutamate O-methyltransferase n=1 Tax=Desulfurispirillum indicum (strain ATCC BAA-1389 / DSM 22839 / S5) TaxID=653733 RepID=E6W1U7_DESIS|nr:protein-glutamate O-methyltransferase CheR [Desulfurispirillum indicum]ADU65479.1 Protein-glutamate O-methyltransferase [Desulfurispirillum indicum S5]